MSSFWNRDVKRFVMVIALTWLLGGVFFNLAIFQYCERVKKEEYNAYANLVEAVRERYADIPEEELVMLFQRGSASEEGKTFLRQYGILESGELLSGQRSGRIGFILWMNGGFFLAVAATSFFFFLFWRRRGRKLHELGSYVDKVSHGEYQLDVRSNQEDELSGLRNELYKLTVSYREQAKEARAGKEALAESVANISHQLKTPLASAVILADNLLESPQMEPEVRTRFLQEISRQLVGMKWLVLTMLKLSRLDAGVVTFQRERVSLKELAVEAMKNLELMAQWKEITFQTKLEEILITGDPKWLLEALQNILKNAIEHSPQAAVIELETQENEVYVQISVRDHGEGIADVDQKHLFERFYRASKVENENVGIGLALAKEIVEKQNGSITVESGADGTCFMIRFLKYAAY